MRGTALRARAGRASDVLVVAALGVLVVFPVLAYRAAGRQPVAPPPSEATLAPLGRGPGGDLRALPAVDADGPAARALADGATLTNPAAMHAALDAAARRVLPPPSARAFLELVEDQDLEGDLANRAMRAEARARRRSAGSGTTSRSSPLLTP